MTRACRALADRDPRDRGARLRARGDAGGAADRVALLIGNNNYALDAAAQRGERREGPGRGAEGARLPGDRARERVAQAT